MKNNKLVIAYNMIMPGAKADELDVLDEVKIVRQAAEKLGYQVSEVPVSLEVKQAMKQILDIAPKAIFNLVESIENKGDLIFFAPAIFNTLKIPYTGAHLESMFITSNKVLTKKELQRNSLPTASWFYPSDVHKINPLGQYILKPLWEEGSLGLDEENVFFGNNMAMIEKVKKLRKEDFFIEEFIDGRELNISMLAGPEGPEVLPPAEMKFFDFPENKPRIVGYTAKWVEDAFEYKHTARTFEFAMEDAEMLTEVKNICLKCWDVFDLKGHVRVDLRLDKNNKPFILEINTNPCISPDSGFYAAAAKAGISFEKVVERIINDAF